jgi:DNA (cytosine-5)-methyltransferase 1
VFLVENVKGLITHEKGETFKNIIEMFENSGKYKLYHKVLNSKNYGVPQKRERVIIIGVKASIKNEFTYPEENPNMVYLKDILKDVPDSPGSVYPQRKAEIMSLVPQGGCWVDLPKDIQLEYMGERSMAAGGGKRGMARRLSMNEQCLTLTTSPCQKQTERCHPTETRPLTTREYARIQTFPDSYKFEGGTGNIYKQIGNAVPVELARAVATQITTFLKS